MLDQGPIFGAKLAAVQNRLLARIHRRYETTTEHYSIGPLRLPFIRIRNPDAVLNQIVENEDRRERITGVRPKDDELHLPYWAEIWASGIGMAYWLADHLKAARESNSTSEISNGDVDLLDLGCGMGFSGMAAAAMGARVMFADLEADALLFARLNTLRWGERVTARRLNWQTDRLPMRFDRIIGADVLYDRIHWPYLETFFRAHLQPHGLVALGEPGRPTGGMFLEWIAERGWKVDVMEQSIPDRPRPIHIFCLRPK